MHARHAKRTISGSGSVQYLSSASPMTSNGAFGIAGLLCLHLCDHPPELSELLLGEVPGILQDIGNRRRAKRVHDAAHHRGHHLLVRTAVLDGVEHLLLALPSNLDEVLVDEAIEGRGHGGVRDIPGLLHFPVDLPGRGFAEGPDRPEDRQFELAEFHGITLRIVILYQTFPVGPHRRERLKLLRLAREVGEPFLEDVERRDERLPRAEAPVRFELEADLRRVVEDLHGFHVVRVRELAAVLAVRTELDGDLLGSWPEDIVRAWRAFLGPPPARPPSPLGAWREGAPAPPRPPSPRRSHPPLQELRPGNSQ